MTRDELEEQIRSVLSKKLSQEQMTRGKISEENEEKNLPDFSMNGLQVAIGDRIDDYDSETAIQIYIPEERKYEVVSYKEMKEIAEKEKRTPFAKLVNQLMLKMEASLIVEGSEGYRNLTDFGRRITSEIMGTDEYFSNVGEFDESGINEDECITIGMLKADYWEENGSDRESEDYLDIEFLGNGKVRLIVRNVDYDEGRDEGDIEEEHYVASTVVSMEELQNFSDSLPGLYPKLPERMMAEGKFFDDNGRFSEDEVRDFLKQKYVPGQFFDVSVGDGSENYGQIHLSIPNGMVTDLTVDMFEKYKENLVEVSIPFSVKSIDKDTFSNCPKLKKVVMFDLPREQNPFDLFENCPNLDSILIVPEEAVQYYKQGDDIHGDLPIGSVYESNENGEGHTTFYVMGDNFERKCKLIEIKRSGHDILEVAEAVSDRRTEDINGIVSEILEATQDKEKDDISVQEV